MLVQLERCLQLQIESDYHSASFTCRNLPYLETWIYTNSTEVTLSYVYDRLGQISTNKKSIR